MTGDDFADLLDELDAAYPVKREIRVEGIDRSLWVWRLEPEQILDLSQTPHESQTQNIEYQIKLIGAAIGTEEKPGAFATDRGRQWLMRHPRVLLDLSRIAIEFNELGGPSEDRKKKSETQSD